MNLLMKSMGSGSVILDNNDDARQRGDDSRRWRSRARHRYGKQHHHHALLDGNFNSSSNINDFVKMTQDGSNIAVAVDTDGAGTGATWEDVSILENYGTPGNDLTLLIDGTDHHLMV